MDPDDGENSYTDEEDPNDLSESQGDDEGIDLVKVKSNPIMMNDESRASSMVGDEEEDDEDPSKNKPILDQENQVIPDLQQFEADKKSVYTHPLFPLLALLLEKCEYATGTLSVMDTKDSSSSTFNSEIEAFVKHQRKDDKPFLSDNPEADALMIKAIQVLRIHLLELEKVSELCKDFCHRYITCLRTKMNSENLLRGTTGVANSFDGSSCSSASSDEGSSSGQPTTFHSEKESNPSQPVFQMVQLPTGLLLHQTPITSTPTVAPIQGSTPLSQIGIPNTSNNGDSVCNAKSISGRRGNSKQLSAPSRIDSGNEGDLSDEASNTNQNKKAQKRGVLPKQATSVMRSWLFQHIVHPYPTEDEKRSIAAQTNLTLLQVNNWFINARRRILQPMLDSANSLNSNDSKDGSTKNGSSGGAAKKLKTCGKSASLQRFWPESIASAIEATPSGKHKESK